MLKIAICDDDEIICSKIEKIILKYGEMKQLFFEIEILYSGEDLIKVIQQGEFFDLIFLDIELRHMNGIEVGKIIREKMKNELTKIVYISSLDNYAMDLFEVRPLHFLIKPINQDKVVWAVCKTIELMKKYEEIFEFKYNKTIVRVPLKKIMCFTSDARKIIIITVQANKEFYGKLSNIEKQLNNDFLRIHKSYLINCNYVRAYTYENIQLCNGQVLNIAKKYRNLVKETLMKRGKDNNGGNWSIL